MPGELPSTEGVTGCEHLLLKSLYSRAHAQQTQTLGTLGPLKGGLVWVVGRLLPFSGTSASISLGHRPQRDGR
jgi:hypothetical protein